MGELWPKVEDWNWETIFYRHYRSTFNHCDVIGQQSNRIRRKKCKIRAIEPFKVIQGNRGWYQSKARMRLPISNWQPISYRFGVMAAYCSNFWHFAFLSPFAGLGTTYDVHLGLIGKRVVDFLLVLIELLSLGVTAEALRASIGSKSAISPQRGPVDPKFQCSIKIWIDFSSVLSQFTPLTDGRTDGQTPFSSLYIVCADIPCSAEKCKKHLFGKDSSTVPINSGERPTSSARPIHDYSENVCWKVYYKMLNSSYYVVSCDSTNVCGEIFGFRIMWSIRA